MKKLCLIPILLLLISLTSCGEKSVNNTIIYNDLEKLWDYDQYNAELSSVNILRQKTDVENKTATICVEATGENEHCIFVHDYTLEYELWDNGWILSSSSIDDYKWGPIMDGEVISEDFVVKSNAETRFKEAFSNTNSEVTIQSIELINPDLISNTDFQNTFIGIGENSYDCYPQIEAKVLFNVDTGNLIYSACGYVNYILDPSDGWKDYENHYDYATIDVKKAPDDEQFSRSIVNYVYESFSNYLGYENYEKLKSINGTQAKCDVSLSDIDVITAVNHTEDGTDPYYDVQADITIETDYVKVTKLMQFRFLPIENDWIIDDDPYAESYGYVDTYEFKTFPDKNGALLSLKENSGLSFDDYIYNDMSINEISVYGTLGEAELSFTGVNSNLYQYVTLYSDVKVWYEFDYLNGWYCNLFEEGDVIKREFHDVIGKWEYHDREYGTKYDYEFDITAINENKVSIKYAVALDDDYFTSEGKVITMNWTNSDDAPFCVETEEEISYNEYIFGYEYDTLQFRAYSGENADKTGFYFARKKLSKVN